MLTKESKAVLKMLKSLSGNTDQPIGFLMNTTKFCLERDLSSTCDFAKYDSEINSVMDMLERNGLIRDIGNNEIRLTQTGIHFQQYRLHRLWLYLRDHWIDVLAMLISLAALIISLIAPTAPG